ncbi:rho GTPase-activating protein SYDE1 isoform X2 [Erinaceus europaeus]|uniref:Rho GTPase-activating protein SYDE1 isoform X2 n=1 Tax=Erinaceus europaeus TaxID=9365 RepID=A0ABM3WP00_ERIEU|nr:rho GTPase-activating protein SYDE1 isoform X2 [Erinaceus europaeus]
MAQPLLRRTLSRLRGRPRKTPGTPETPEGGRPAQRVEPSPPEPEPQGPQEPPTAAERPPSPEASRSPARGVYLQSLEASSRRWVLSGAKPPEEAALGCGEPAGEIWYNPIPEDDPRGPAPEHPGVQPGSEEAQAADLAGGRRGARAHRPAAGGARLPAPGPRLPARARGRAPAARARPGLGPARAPPPRLRTGRRAAAGRAAREPGPAAGGSPAAAGAALRPAGADRAAGGPGRGARVRGPPAAAGAARAAAGTGAAAHPKVVGLYRLCGSAAVKKELRKAFEQDSAAVSLSEGLHPDIHVITGILKDYLRELPTTLITPPLYQAVLEAMARGPPSRAPPSTESTRALLGCLPEVERATLTFLLDHLRLVSSFHAHNRMTPQNLAVCFGPVLLPARQAPSRPRIHGSGSGPGLASADVDFKRHIEVLHYLLRAWPDPQRPPEASEAASALSPEARPPLHLPLAGPDGVVTRTRDRGGPESPPSNRYAGDWSVCGRDFLPGPEDAGDRETDSEDDDVDDIEAPFIPHLNLSDFDALILDLERELAQQINVCL